MAENSTALNRTTTAILVTTTELDAAIPVTTTTPVPEELSAADLTALLVWGCVLWCFFICICMYLLLIIQPDAAETRERMDRAKMVDADIEKFGENPYMLLRSPLLHSENPDDMVIHRKSLFTGLFSEVWHEAKRDLKA